MTTAELLAATKKALRKNDTEFDDEIQRKIDSAKADLEDTAGIFVDVDQPLILEAVLTYVRLHYGQPDDYERLLESYNKQKAQLMSCTKYRIGD